MAYSETVRSDLDQPAQAIAIRLAGRMFARIAASRQAAAQREAARALRNLDPHLLEDIGITRDDLRRTLRDGGPDA